MPTIRWDIKNERGGCGWMKNESAMKIVMTKRKSGLYAQWYVVRGLDARGELCDFLIFSNQAKNYAQAVRFWEKMWGKTCTAFSLHNADPFSDHILNAC